MCGMTPQCGVTAWVLHQSKPDSFFPQAWSRDSRGQIVRHSMWIQNTRLRDDGTPVTRSFKHDWMEKPVEFTTSGKANVPEDVAARLIEDHDHLEPTESDDDDDGGADEDAGDSSE